MSWFSPILLTANERSSGAWPSRAAERDDTDTLAGAAAARARREAGRDARLGSAWASDQWAWSAEPAQTPPATSARPVAHHDAPQGASLRAPVEVLRQMSDAARGLGRSESEVWVEAARDWLRRREGEPGAPPVAAAPEVAARPAATPRRIARLWDDIDALLIELRAPAGASAQEREGAPAA